MPDTQTADSSWDSLIKRASGLSGESQTLQSKLGESAKVSRGIAQKILDMKPPQAPEIAPPAPPPPAMKETPPLDAFGSFASALGILGGALTRQPLMTSLKAATGAMNGIHQHDYETYQRQYDTWKQQSEYASQLSKWQTDRYKMAMDEYKGNQDQMFAALNALAAANKDTIAQHALATGDLRMFENLLMDRESIRSNMDSHALHVQEWNKNNMELQNRADIMNASKALVEARKSGDPKQVAEAQTRLQDALMTNPTYAAAVGRREAALSAKKELETKQTDTLIKEADDLVGMIDKNPSVVGTRGLIGGAIATAKGILDPRAKTDQSYQEFETLLKAFQTQASLAISGSKYYSAARREEMSKMLPGLTKFTSAQDAKAALQTMKTLLEGGRQEIDSGGGEERPQLPNVGDVLDGYRYKGGPPGQPESWEAVE